MANPISGAYQAQQAAQINPNTQTHTNSRPANQTASPKDTVTISQAGQAASQAHQAAQTAKPANDGDHDGS
jgi:hypothetical protein